MLTANVETPAAVGHSTNQNRLVGPEVITRVIFGGFLREIASQSLDKIEHGGRKMPDRSALLMGYIPRHSQGLR